METATTAQLSSPSATALHSSGVNPVVLSQEKVRQLLERLAEPFAPSVVEWVVSATSQGKDGHRGLMAAYADPRAYLDRLNQLFTAGGWTQDYSFQVVGNVERKGREGKVSVCAKVMACCRVTIFGVGTHSGTGEHWADDENAVTGGDAQAFKRACVCFGLGRYLYDVPQVWVDLDEFKRPRWLPDLPAWALPGGVSRETTPHGKPGGTGQTGNGQNGNGTGATGRAKNGNRPSMVTGNGAGRAETLDRIQVLSKVVGRNIFRSILVAVAGVENATQISDVGKLKAIVERLESAERGVQRLKAAVGKVGREAHAALCRELKLQSATTDDIPDTKMLRRIVERLEEQASALPKGKTGTQVSGTDSRAQGASKGAAPASDFAGLRNEVLALSRRLASRSKRQIADIVAWASDGALQYADIGKLTAADVPKLQVTVKRLRESGEKT